MNVVCFSLDGLLSPQDSACTLMKLFPGGQKVFDAISRYDNLLTLEKRDNHEPGDMLSFIVPFLVFHGVKEYDISKLAMRATLTNGAAELITKLQNKDWKVFCITASYRHYALHITQRLDIFSQNIACTLLPLDSYYQLLNESDFRSIKQLENEITTASQIDDEWIKRRLDNLFLNELPHTHFKSVLEGLKSVGGQRQIEALNKFNEKQKISLSDWIVVGNSYIDSKMLQEVNHNGGIAIACNADEHALSHSTFSLASTNLIDLLPVFDLYDRDDKLQVERFIRTKETTGGDNDRNNFHWLMDSPDISKTLEIHETVRKLVREETASSE
jgi:predicted HAD superfamily phosphohydrolase